MRAPLPIVVQISILLLTFFLLPIHSTAQTLTILHSFEWGADGADPQSGLTLDDDGNLYGTTVSGGIGNLGTAFQVTPDGVESVLYHNFSGWRGWGPNTALVRDANGVLYGTTFQGGSGPCNDGFGCGSVFRVKPSGKGAVLHRFNPWYPGYAPNGNLVMDAEGNLYGTTVYGGVGGGGSVFEITRDGVYVVLHNFGWDDGAAPFAGVIRDAAGNLYGTTRKGGAHDCGDGSGCGTVFQITPSGEEKILHSFSGQPDGNYPVASLVLDPHGNLYGTTTEGGTYGQGTIFEIDSAGEEKVLHSFAGGMDGRRPTSSLIRDKRGNLYGTTTMDGLYGFGTVYKLTPAGRKKVLHDFSGYPDGGYPAAGLVLDKDGNLYGTTRMGGAHYVGTVFKLTP